MIKLTVVWFMVMAVMECWSLSMFQMLTRTNSNTKDPKDPIQWVLVEGFW